MPPSSPRKGARRMSDIPPDVLAALNAGEIEAITLVEMLAVNFACLFRVAFPKAGKAAFTRMEAASTLGILDRNRLAGSVLYECFGDGAMEQCAGHSSDIVRGWACYALAATPGLTLPQRLKRIQPWADDPNPGVREWAWMAVRLPIAAEVEKAIKLLLPWTKARSANLRRFASEATRPRGVWCAHIDALKQDPSLALPLLEPLRADPAKYVQLSVANWLNDASKSQPAWVRSTCARWQKESPVDATEKIITRGLRTLRKVE